MSWHIERLTSELHWPRLGDLAALERCIQATGVHCVFVPGDPERNLESSDVAVILPELHMAFQGQFEVAVAEDAIANAVGEAAGVYKTPSLIFFREGAMIGAIPKVRDWQDYTARIARILQNQRAA